MSAKKYLAALSLAAVICIAPNIAYAAEANSPPQEPSIENLSADDANKLIEKYNEEVEAYNDALEDAWAEEMDKVDAYNDEVFKHNQQVDADYEAAVQETKEKNTEITAHNQAEENRVAQETAQNEQAQKDADEQNARIDEQNAEAAQKAAEAKENNEKKRQEKTEYDAAVDKEYEDAVAAEQQRVDEANAAEQERAAQAKEDNKKIEEQYAAELEQYQKDLAQYEKDKAIEDKILALGYSSVEEYNARIKRSYNDPADAAVDGNKSAKGIADPPSASVEEATVKAGKTYKVYITNTYEVNGKILEHREVVYEFDLNDIVTTYPDAYYYIPTGEGYATFYKYISDEYLQGYWAEAYSSFTYDVLYLEQFWQNGDARRFSYKDGGKYGQTGDLYLDYYYTWVPLSKYALYNTPQQPIAPVKGELKDEEVHLISPVAITRKPYMEITLENESYEVIPYVIPNLIEVAPADIWDLLDIPVRGQYRDYLDYPDEPEWLDEWDYILPLEDEDTPLTDNPATTENNENSNNNNNNNIFTISLVDTAYADTPQENRVKNIRTNLSNSNKPQDVIDEDTVPLASAPVEDNWALLNLIFMLINIILLVSIPRKKEDEEYTYKHRNNIPGIVLAIVAVVIFILTENVYLPMILVDSWTPLMGIVCGGGIVAKILNHKKREEKSLDDTKKL